jgi:hypothetical protein
MTSGAIFWRAGVFRWQLLKVRHATDIHMQVQWHHFHARQEWQEWRGGLNIIQWIQFELTMWDLYMKRLSMTVKLRCSTYFTLLPTHTVFWVGLYLVLQVKLNCNYFDLTLIWNMRFSRRRIWMLRNANVDSNFPTYTASHPRRTQFELNTKFGKGTATSYCSIAPNGTHT